MNPAVGFALLSMVFVGIIDVTYKVYARESRSRGMFLCMMGVVWGGLQLAFAKATDTPIALETSGLGYAVTAGLFLTCSNIALIEALAHVPVSLGSTIYRLNTIGVVLLAWLLLGEDVGVLKLSGIGFGVVAVLLLYQPERGAARDRRLVASCVLAVFASVMRASYGVTSKAGLSAGVAPEMLMLVAAACWMTGGVAYAALRERTVVVSAPAMRIGLIAGIVVFAIVNTLMAALDRGEASVVVPISNLGFLAALAISVLAGWESMNRRKGAAIAMAVVAIGLLSGS